MASTNTHMDNFKICSINICGMSTRSRFMLDKYVDINKYDAVAVQESETNDAEKLVISNMQALTDDNSSRNKGSVLYTNKNYSTTKLKELNQISKTIDTSWVVTVTQNKRLIIGSIYIKLNNLEGVQDTIKMLNKAYDLQRKFRASGVILTGDFNCRHISWGDSTSNAYGRKLVELLDTTKFSICTARTPTFLSTNGSSCIDLTIVTNNLAENLVSICTDTEAELYSGAPFRGHLPLISTFKLNTRTTRQAQATEKICTANICWDSWTSDLEEVFEQNETYLQNLNEPRELRAFIDKKIEYVTLKHGTKKSSSGHSKPYWTSELTTLCNNMRQARKSYCKRNTHSNKARLIEAKEIFDAERKRECQDFLLKKTKNLNSTQAQRFWKEFNKIFRKKTDQKIDPLFDSENNLLTDSAEVDELMFSTFFEGHHLNQGDFDNNFYLETNRIYEDILNTHINDEEDENGINSEITISEIKTAIKSYNSSGKSSDKENFNPVMFKHLGEKAIKYIKKLSNLCLSHGTWIWDKAEVVFLKKNGKDSYDKPGAYRPISISSYIGKLIEKILAERIKKYLISRKIYDPNQEGFMEGRNTVRYLNRLISGIKGDIQKKLTVLCLFIDFEKAFDSVWKAGLIVKLHKLGIKGKLLKLVNNFLINRKVTMNINGVVGDIRKTSEVGLPQGSALSPILFRIFIMDMFEDLENNEAVQIFKFADDGTVKVQDKTTPLCLETLQLVLTSVESWVKKHRMIINCQPNKTEVMCFSSAEKDRSLVPDSYKVCGKEIKLVQHTKALGLIIDEELNFNEHSKMVHKKLMQKWVEICKYSNRHWGFNQRIMVQLIKTFFHSTLFYAGHIWMQKNNLTEINKLYYKIVKASVGAIFNIRLSVAEMILGLPPLEIINTVNQIKHYLKIKIQDSPGDILKEFIAKELNVEDNARNTSEIKHSVRQAMKFLKWKNLTYPERTGEGDAVKVDNLDCTEFLNLKPTTCKYTKDIITKYVEHLWRKSVQNEFLLEGHAVLPTPTTQPLPIDREINREVEVLMLSLFYDNNLLHKFLHRFNSTLYTSPLCDCGVEDQTAHHVLFRCSLVPHELRDSAYTEFQHIVGSELATVDTYITLLNASRKSAFMEKVHEVVRCRKEQLTTTIEL